MKEYIEILKKTKLFAGVNGDEINSMLTCLDARLAKYKRGEYVLCEDKHLRSIAVLVSGELHVQRDDYWGNRTIINRIGVGEMFGEAYIAPECGALPIDVLATTDSRILFFDLYKIMTVCSSACPFHTAVVQNLFYAISEKNRTLVQKLGYLSKRTTREKLLSYLSDEAKKQKNAVFTIPFNRQQLADFLSVDRSAMSNELCKMRNEGILEFKKNKFRLL